MCVSKQEIWQSMAELSWLAFIEPFCSTITGWVVRCITDVLNFIQFYKTSKLIRHKLWSETICSSSPWSGSASTSEGPRFIENHELLKRYNTRPYLICLDSGQLWRRHIDHVKQIGESSTEPTTATDDSEMLSFPLPDTTAAPEVPPGEGNTVSL